MTQRAIALYSMCGVLPRCRYYWGSLGDKRHVYQFVTTFEVNDTEALSSFTDGFKAVKRAA